MATTSVPQADFAIIGGAVTRQIRFPEDIGDPDIEVVATRLQFDTPLGQSIPFKLLRFSQDGQTRHALFARYLGVRGDATRMPDSEQVFWVLREAGVKRIISDDNMGGLNTLLEPGDVVICHDFIDLHKHASTLFMPGQLVRMRDPYCPELRERLIASAGRHGFKRVFRRGVYAVSHGTRFESPAEISMYKQLGGDIVGYSLIPSIYLARAIGACFAGIYLVVNYGEGLISDWNHDSVWTETDRLTPQIGRILLDVLKHMPLEHACRCASYVTPRPRATVEYPDK